MDNWKINNWQGQRAYDRGTINNGDVDNRTYYNSRSDNDLSQAEKDGMLLEQARRGSTPGVHRCVALGANGTNVSDDDGRTSLHHAVRNCSTGSVEWILEVDEDINASDDIGFTALGHAMRLSPSSKKDDIIKMLRDKGALVDPPSRGISANTRTAERDSVSTQEIAPIARLTNRVESDILRYQPVPVRSRCQ